MKKAILAALVVTAVVGISAFDARAWEADRADVEHTGEHIFTEQGRVDLRGTWKIDGTEVTATAAELNLVDGLTVTTAELNALDVPTAGTVGTNGESVVETYGAVNKTTITLNNTLIATDGSAEGETQVLYTFPAGRIYILGGAINATTVNSTTEADTNDTFTYGIGTAAANDDADLSDSNEADVFAAVALSDGAVTLTNQWEADFTAGADSVFDGTATAVTLNLNMGIADACITTGNFTNTFTGSCTVFWINLGDD